MLTRMMSFVLRTLTAACVLGAIVFVGAYTQGEVCAQMLLTPACLLLAYAACGMERELRAQARRLRALNRAAGRPARAQYFAINSRSAS